MKVYLGGTKGIWRKLFKRRFPKWICYDPFEQSDQTCVASFTTQDLKVVKESDIVFFVINYGYFEGSCVEAGYAFALGKPIFLVFLLKTKLPSMFVGISKRVFVDFDEALEYLERRYYDV